MHRAASTRAQRRGTAAPQLPAASSSSSAAPGYTPQPVLGNPARSNEVLSLLARLLALSLSLGLNETALFVAERYSCLCPASEEAVFYHALALLRCEQYRLSLELLKSTIVLGDVAIAGERPACEASVRCAWVYAEACTKLDRPNEGGECLKRAFSAHSSGRASKSALPERAQFPAASANNAMNSSICINLSLAKLAVQANKPDLAAQRYHDALKAAWWCWEAYEGLCALGKAPDPETLFDKIPVPIVTESAERQQDPPPASFLAAPSMSAQNSRQGLFPQSNKPISSTSATSSTSFLPAQQHPGLPAISSTPSFVSEKVKQKTTAEQAGFRFGESAAYPEVQRERSATAEPEDSEMQQSSLHPSAAAVDGRANRSASMSFDDIPMGDGTGGSSFFATTGGPARPGGSGGLFGFGKASGATAATVAPRKGSGPLFGSGLLFGQGGQQQPTLASSSSAAAPSGGSFFTPVNMRATGSTSSMTPEPHPSTSQAGFSNRTIANGRPPPAVKRNRNQVDVDDSLPSFSFGPQSGMAALAGKGRTNGHAQRIEGDDSDMLLNGIDGEGYERKADVLRQAGSQGADMLDVQAAPRKGSAPNLGLGTRRSTRLTTGPGSTNGIHGEGGGGRKAAAATSAAMMAKSGNRTTSNPRDRKRSKASPSSLYDDTASESHSFESVSQNGHATSMHAYPSTSSSSPPMATSSSSQLENIPPQPLVYETGGNAFQTRQSSSARASSQTPFFTSSSSQNQQSRSGPTSQPLQQSQSAVAHASYKAQVQAAQQALAENWLRELFLGFGKAYSCLSRFDAAGTVRAVMELPVEQAKSARAIGLVGRAHFESLNYAKAEQAFSSLRELAPFRTAEMDIYSTLLWHLHRPTQLSFLAQELMAISPRRPQAWIATGNVFSHLEDHANALKCFKRAIQSDPSWTYAYTLAGHECVTLEEWETAMGFFREAISKEPRHYNAWFGLGNVYMKTGKHRLAEYHFRKAIEINPSNAMLVSCVGTVLEKLDKKKQALEMYERACLLAPTSPAVRFKRVRMLMEHKQYEVCLGLENDDTKKLSNV